MSVVDAARATLEAFELAEGPVWHDGRAIWVDILAGEVIEGRFSAMGVEVVRRTRVDAFAGAALPTADGGLLVAGHERLIALSPDGTRTDGPRVVPAGVASRCNDAAVDPMGRLLVGTLALTPTGRRERLLRLEDDGSLTVIDDDLGLSNGISWSPDGATLYHADTEGSVVWARDYDPETGRVGARVRHLDVDGWPDGLTTDASGGLWVAIWGASEVRHYRGGSVTDVVRTTAPHTSSVAFAGAGLDTLLITSARQGLDAAALARFPDSGALFTASVGEAGIPQTPARIPDAGFAPA